MKHEGKCPHCGAEVLRWEQKEDDRVKFACRGCHCLFDGDGHLLAVDMLCVRGKPATAARRR